MAENDIETLVLRFRDLAVPDTIKEHQSIISSSEEKYCWWGWWNKPQEQVPCDIFAKLNNIAKKNSLDIFLFDSGHKKLYTAKCVEIYFSTDLTACSLPVIEINKIPTYYKSQSYLAWFKFKKIEEIEKFILTEYSYVNVESFFTERKKSFQMFNNKKICSPEELYYQQRTIWFIRKFIKGDSTQEINLMSDRKALPQNYDDLFTQLKSNSILWLSDLHFSNDYPDKEGNLKNYHAYGRSKTDDDKLSTKIKYKLDKNGISPSAIVISGDITYKAQKEEFSLSEKFIREIDSFYSIDSYNLAICPGNHDFSFEESTDISTTTETASKNYKLFYNNIFNCEPSETFSSIRRFLTKNLTPVEFICLNSVSLQQINVKSEIDGKANESKFVGLGYVGSNQISEVEKYLKSTENSNAIRIMVIHHHLVPVMFSEQPEINKTYSLILDAGRVNKFIFENNIKVVLHGHAHKQFYRRIGIDPNGSQTFDCNIVGIGSAGVCSEKLSEENPNMFGILSFEKDILKVEKFRVDDSGELSDLICRHSIQI